MCPPHTRHYFGDDRKDRGFTLLELLTVIATIGILAALLVPAANVMRQSAQSAKCMGNLKAIVAATHAYASDYDGRILYYYIERPSMTKESWWRLELQNKGYLAASKEKAAWCPSLPIDDKVATQCYGMRIHSPPTESFDELSGGNFADKVQYEIALSRISKPARFALYADSARPAETGGKLRQYYRFSMDPLGKGSKAGVHLRHNGRGNIAFLDGHVESLGPAGMEEVGILSGYDIAGQLVRFQD